MRIVLQTTRLMLREMSLDDLDFVAAMLADPEVMRFYPNCYSRDEARTWVQRQITRYTDAGHGLWLVIEKASQRPVGQVGLIQQQIEGRVETEVGYLIHRPFWRRGWACEAAAGCRDYAFEQLGLERLISLIRPVNKPSRGVARKIGLTWNNRQVLHAGWEHRVYSITRDEWLSDFPLNSG